jgi:hypothetical protein
MATGLGPFSLERMVRAVEKVRERLLRAAGALEAAGVPYAVVGGNAVAAFVARVDEAAVRNTPNVDILTQREDWLDSIAALGKVGFVPQPGDPACFLDGTDGKPRDRVRLLFAGERFRATDLLPHPGIPEAETSGPYRVLQLRSLVQTKLVGFRIIDRVHLRDLMGVGLIDVSWVQHYPPELAARLQALIDDPNG